MRRQINMILSLALLVFPGAENAGGQGAETEWDIFASASVIELTLVMDMDSLLADLGEHPSYHDAILRYRDPGHNRQEQLNVRVRARGSFRKNPENCDFPPLKFKFDRIERQGSIFNDIKELKLVTHCQDEFREYEQYVLQEYLIYRAYNILTEFSLRVRLARITYVDLPQGNDSITRYAFMIEDAEDMAERNKGVLLDLETVSEARLDEIHFRRMALFNYMILNTDYSVPIVHNIELVSLEHFSPPIPVPYDFDWSGMINIPYESPYADGKTRYAGRQYKGPCLKRKELEEAFMEMHDKRDQFYGLYRDCPYLDEDLRSRNIQELDLFYTIIGNRKLVRQAFISDCED